MWPWSASAIWDEFTPEFSPALPQFSLVGLVDPVAENLAQADADFTAPGFRELRELPGERSTPRSLPRPRASIIRWPAS